jgi:hypothetical protein
MNASLHDYAAFLAAKRVIDPPTGISADIDLPPFLFAHQRDIVRWALRRGRAGIFADTGLGKTNMELVWADVVAHATGGPALIVAPLAVAAQHVREAEKFGLDARLATSAADLADGGVAITNYGKLDRFDLSKLSAIVLDESSILKAHDGKTRSHLIEACRSIPFRLAATATPAPNDFMELGNHAEFLGVMSWVEMLATFFVHDGGETQKWRMKRHAEQVFWQWMASWSVMLRKPSDLGYSDDGYELPPLSTRQHVVAVDLADTFAGGTLFPVEARTMQERIRARRDTVSERVALAARLVAEKSETPWVVWCNINDEAEAITAAIPGAVEVRGSDREADKERKLVDFAEGRIRVLVTKPKIAGYGCNWQHCADTVFVGLNDSFEQIFQAIRRFWRFGQMRQVNAHFIASELEGAVVANLARKEAAAGRMAAAMVACMADLSTTIVHGVTREKSDYRPVPVPLPHFLGV